MRLSELTTLRVGGEARQLLAPTTRVELIETMRDVWSSGEEWMLLGGGSNVLVGDDDLDGTVVRVLTRGIERLEPPTDAASESIGTTPPTGTVLLRIQAGENWDELVALTVANGWAGIEALSGIPGSCGAAPIQNIGAYGQEIASSLVSLEFFDYLSGEIETLSAEDLKLDYRTSILKQGKQGVVLSIDLRLRADSDGLSDPIQYAQLAGALGVNLGERVSLATLREKVLALRASKGMLLDAADPDSVSAGSFFTNPIVSENFARQLPAEAPRWAMDPEPDDVVLPLAAAGGIDPGVDPGFDAGFTSGTLPVIPAAVQRTEFRVKLSAAWLIENSGIRRGFRLPGSRAAVSSKHTLALVNTGGASAADISELARYIQTRVLAEFGVMLHPEPVLVGVRF